MSFDQYGSSRSDEDVAEPTPGRTALSPELADQLFLGGDRCVLCRNGLVFSDERGTQGVSLALACRVQLGQQMRRLLFGREPLVERRILSLERVD